MPHTHAAPVVPPARVVRHTRFVRSIAEAPDGTLDADPRRDPFEDDGTLRVHDARGLTIRGLAVGERVIGVLLDEDDVPGGEAMRGRVIGVVVERGAVE